jgi:hypothetical protein
MILEKVRFGGRSLIEIRMVLTKHLIPNISFYLSMLDLMGKAGLEIKSDVWVVISV